MSLFSAKCNLILEVSTRPNILEITRSILEWHRLDPETYPTYKQEKLINSWWAKYKDKVDAPVKRISSEIFTCEV